MSEAVEYMRILQEAANELEEGFLTYAGYSPAEQSQVHEISVILMNALRATAAEYAEGLEERKNVTIACDHCHDNLNIARLILGFPTETWDEEEDDW